VDKQNKRGFNLPTILVIWEMWKYRNDGVFSAASPNVNKVVWDVKE
jgi:hypothetical protein